MTRIDCHVHLLPPAYRGELEGLPLPEADLPDLRAMMERCALDAAVISTGPPGAYIGDNSAAPRLARIANDGIAEIVRGAPAQFAGLATLPLPDLDAALGELARALDELTLDGVMLLTNAAGIYLGDRAWEPLFEELDRRGAYVFVHPAFPHYPLPLPHPAWLYELPLDTVRAVVNLIYSGTFERYPNIRFQVAHLGGAVPFLAHRLASLADREPDQVALAPAGALEYLRRIYYDTGLATNGPALRAAADIAPLERIVFGTDWPYLALAPGEDPTAELAALGPDAQENILTQNPETLVPRLITESRCRSSPVATVSRLARSNVARE